MLKNHGTLYAAESIAEAFYVMYNHEKACSQQVRALTIDNIDDVIQVSDEILKKIPLELNQVLDGLPKHTECVHLESNYDVIFDAWINRMKNLYPNFDE